MATTACPECDGTVRPDCDESVCTDCGLVVDTDHVDRGPDWRSFDDGPADGKRTGAPLTRSRHDRGLSTTIGHGSETRLTGRKRRRVARMRREHARARISTKRDRNQVYAFTEIRRLVGALSLPDSIRDQACTIFESAQEEDLLQGRTLEGFAAAAVYATCRVRSLSRTVEALVDVARADERELRVAYDALNRDLGLPTGPVDPREYLPRYANELDLDQSIEGRAHDLATAAVDSGHATGRNPSGVAAGCLYLAASEAGAPCTQAEAAEAADVSAVTVRHTYQALDAETN
ncbi:transcription initiation factor IIB family protein [Halorubellus sp. JP-L1]|uniref:transcription initiation factor IIB n=1 Tax=Halorubellus sp. JP-L1 TaxID=2715753 RepID=UPI00140B84A0|nr:transcription initiation factor IIB family protein [Halorubellus sp. JP-L1]NHN41784.1 transcription initiation factor IIB family protein [Halorubellus sp. JP-L1]